MFVYSANLEVPRMRLAHNDEYGERTKTPIRTLFYPVFVHKVKMKLLNSELGTM